MPGKKLSGKKRINSRLKEKKEKVLRKPVKLFEKGRKTKKRIFADLMNKVIKDMKNKNKTPRRLPVFFVSNISEYFSMIPEWRTGLKNHLKNEMQKDPSYNFSQKECDYFVDKINVKGKKSDAAVVFIGSKADKKAIRRTAQSIVDPEFEQRLRERVYERLGKKAGKK